MWREMYDRVARRRTKTTQPGHFPRAEDAYSVDGSHSIILVDPTEHDLVEPYHGVIPPYDMPPCDEDPEPVDDDDRWSRKITQEELDEYRAKVAGDFEDVVAGVSIPASVIETLVEALDWYEDDRMECDRIEGRHHEREDHYGIQAARKALQG
jgi:hypothetical protein